MIINVLKYKVWRKVLVILKEVFFFKNRGIFQALIPIENLNY
jgi:hypothetical protein